MQSNSIFDHEEPSDLSRVIMDKEEPSEHDFWFDTVLIAIIITMIVWLVGFTH